MSTRIRIEERAPGVRIIHIENDCATASVSLFVGQLLTWQPWEETHPVLWVSSLAQFDRKAAIRGGVPIFWPWFGEHPSSLTAPSHGYARLSVWELDSFEVLPDGRTEVLMTLTPEKQTHKYRYPGLFNTVRIVIGEVLDIQSTSRNDSDADLSLTEGLHTYFHTSDIENAEVTRLC